MDNLWEFLVNVNLFLQGFGDWIISPMHWVTFLGDEEFYLLVMPAVYWCIDSSLGIRMGMILMLSNTLGTSLKFLFHSPRPFWVSADVTAHVQETSFGMPSGHALNATALWGFVATRMKNRWIKVIFWALVFLIGFSRMVLGVHMINDVLLGWLAGGILLILFLSIEKKYQKTIPQWSFNKKLAAILISTLVLFALPLLIWIINHDFPINEIWVTNYAAAYPGVELLPYSLEGAITAAATWMGLLIGLLILDQKQISISASGSIWIRIVRYLVGGIGVLVFWMGLKLVFPDGESFVALSLRFFRYTLIGLWVAFGAPYLFIKLNLMKSS
jgi:membrane-associated phospholipid phosphatase